MRIKGIALHALSAAEESTVRCDDLIHPCSPSPARWLLRPWIDL